MNAYFHFMIDSGFSLGVLSLVYLLFLRKETYFKFNRIYLLASVVFSAIMPFVTIPAFSSGEKANGIFGVVLNTVPVYAHTYTDKFSMTLSEYGISGIIYLSGTFLFLILFVFRLFSLTRLLRKSELKHKTETISLMESRDINSPFSFFHFIVLPANCEESPKLNSILTHEKEHVKQYHSLDVLILEMLTVFQWCNPFIWLVRRMVRENHEFLADSAVLNNGFNPNRYKLLLLSQVADGFLITNNFSYSLIKIRIRMITKNKSSRYAAARIGMGVMIAMGLLVSLHLQASNSKIVSTLEDIPILNKVVPQSAMQNNEAVSNKLIIGQYLETGTDNETGINESTSVLKQQAVSGAKIKVHVVNTKSSAKTQKKEKPLLVVEQMPQYPGGLSALGTFLGKKLKYPIKATGKGIQGNVILTFVIDRTGTISNIKVIRGIGGGCEEEAIRVVRLMPKWKPGKQKGKAVPVQYTLPIKFSIQKTQ